VATYVLIHGAGDVAWYWHLVAAELRRRDHDVVAVDLPCQDDAARLSDYAGAVVDAIGTRTRLVVVAQSLGGFTAPLVCAQKPSDLLVLVAGMMPRRGESANQYFMNTRYPGSAAGADDPIALFYHDVPRELAKEALNRGRRQAEAVSDEPWPLKAWPDVPVRFVLCRDDRLFPATWLRGVVRDRLGIEPDEMDSGHCPALSRPKELVEHLEALRARRS
jgi:pimeloyl-ACP methyl ester carboxylesterase